MHTVAITKHVLTGARKMEVLLQLEDSRVAVEVTENEDPLQKIHAVLCDSLEVADASEYVFQRWSKKWDCYVNVSNSRDVQNEDRINVVPKKKNNMVDSQVYFIWHM